MNMTCPFCQREMLPGFLNAAGRQMLWSEREHSVLLVPRRGERYALRTQGTWVSNSSVQADYCPDCQRIIIDARHYDRGGFSDPPTKPDAQ